MIEAEAMLLLGTDKSRKELKDIERILSQYFTEEGSRRLRAARVLLSKYN